VNTRERMAFAWHVSPERLEFYVHAQIAVKDSMLLYLIWNIRKMGMKINQIRLILRSITLIVMTRLELLVSGSVRKQQAIYGRYDLHVSLMKSEISLLFKGRYW